MSNTPQQPGPQPIRLSDVESQAINWLWPGQANLEMDDEEFRPGRIPLGMLTLINGRPGEGKSTLTAWLAAEISNRPNGTRNGVLWSNAEDHLRALIRPRAEAAGANLSNVHAFNFFIPKDDLGIQATLSMLRSMIYGLNIGLIIADPIAAHLGVSIYNDQDVRRVLSPLTQLLEETGTSMVAIHHANKHVSAKGDDQALEAVGGSSGGLTGSARAVYAFGKAPDDPSVRVLAPQKFNIGPGLPSIAFDLEETDWTIQDEGKTRHIRVGRLVHLSDEHPATARQILSASKGEGEGIPAEKKAIAAEWLTTYLVGYYSQTSEWPAAKVVRDDAADQGISFATLRRAADEVGVVKARKGFGPGSYIEWLLPDTHPSMQALGPAPAALPGTDDEPTPIDFDTLASLEAALEATPDADESEEAGA